MSVSRYPHLDWQESSVGRWEREVDETERFYTYLAKSYEGSNRMFFAITGFVSLSVDISVESSPEKTSHLVEKALRNAWLRLRYDHPTIASHVEYDGSREGWIKVYDAFQPGAINDQSEQWLRATFIPVISRVSGLEWCNSDPPAPKFPTLFVLTAPNTQGEEGRTLRRDLVIRSPHDIMDGIGTLQLLNNLLKHTAQAFEEPISWVPPTPGSEYQNLSPPLRVAAAIPPILTLDQQGRLQNIIARNALLRQGTEVLTLPFERGNTMPGKHQRIVRELPVSDASRILEACKSHGFTATHIYHAAVAITLRNMQVRSSAIRQTRYIGYALVNERQRCIEAYGTYKHAAAVYHSVTGEALALDLTIPSATEQDVSYPEQRQEEFWALVKQVRDFYHGYRNTPDNLALVPSFWSMATPHLSTATSTPAVPPPNDSPSVSISSMGVVDKVVGPRHGPFKVDNPWVTGEELGTGLGVFLGTWEGKLQLSAAYNDAWHNREKVDGFLKHCQEVVWTGLGLDG